MAGINKVILIGNLGKDPEVRYTPDGKPVANITLATSDTWKDKNTGERKERTEWHRVVFFGGVAGIVGEYLHKGSKIYLEGKLQTRKWQDNSGQDRYTTEIVVDGFGGVMQMLDPRGGGSTSYERPASSSEQNAPQSSSGQNAPQSSSGQNAPQTNNTSQPATGDFEDDIPF